jgi:hypothetical protein
VMDLRVDDTYRAGRFKLPFSSTLEEEKTERFSHVPGCEFLLPCNGVRAVVVLFRERGISGDF